jgi:hypothetical protein
MIRLTLMTLVLSLVLAGASWADGPPRPVAVMGNRMHFVYVCDASQAMGGKFGMLKKELLKSIDALKPIQEFTVIFLADDKVVAMSEGTVQALPEVKRKAIEFVNGFSPSGVANPVAGFKSAFATKPHVIYFVTDGGFVGGDRVVEELRTLNKDKRVKVNAIAFQPSEAAGKLLRQIADENGGIFKAFAPEDPKR